MEEVILRKTRTQQLFRKENDLKLTLCISLYETVARRNGVELDMAQHGKCGHQTSRACGVCSPSSEKTTKHNCKAIILYGKTICSIFSMYQASRKNHRPPSSLVINPTTTASSNSHFTSLDLTHDKSNPAPELIA